MAIDLRLADHKESYAGRPINWYVEGDKHPEHGLLVDDARYGDRYGAHEDFVAAEQFTNYVQAHNVKPATDRTEVFTIKWT